MTDRQALWPQMIAALAEIDAALGLPEDGCNSTARTLAEINKLKAGLAAPVVERPDEKCQPDGLKFDAFGEPRTRYVRVSLNGGHCVMHPSEGDCYLKDARNCGDE